jgi:hypothetical protein
MLTLQTGVDPGLRAGAAGSSAAAASGSGDPPSLGTEAGFGAAVGSAGAAPTDLSKARATLEADIAALRLHQQGCAGKAKTLATELNVMRGEDGYKEHCRQLKIPFTGGRPDTGHSCEEGGATPADGLVEQELGLVLVRRQNAPTLTLGENPARAACVCSESCAHSA